MRIEKNGVILDLNNSNHIQAFISEGWEIVKEEKTPTPQPIETQPTKKRGRPRKEK